MTVQYKVSNHSLMNALPPVPVIDLGPLSASWRDRALAVRDACLGWLPLGGLLARLGDPLVRRWMRRSGSPDVDEIDAVAQRLGRPGTWLLHGAYLFGCTALASRRLAARPATTPNPGLAVSRSRAAGRGREPARTRRRLPERDVARLRRRADGGCAGRFAAAINQAPMRRRTRGWALLWVDYALNALSALCRVGRLPPEHLLRQVFETCADFDQREEPSKMPRWRGRRSSFLSVPSRDSFW